MSRVDRLNERRNECVSDAISHFLNQASRGPYRLRLSIYYWLKYNVRYYDLDQRDAGILLTRVMRGLFGMPHYWHLYVNDENDNLN